MPSVRTMATFTPRSGLLPLADLHLAIGRVGAVAGCQSCEPRGLLHGQDEQGAWDGRPCVDARSRLADWHRPHL